MACCLDTLSVGICVAMLQREDELAKVLTVHMLFTFNHRCQLAELLDAAGLALEEPDAAGLAFWRNLCTRAETRCHRTCNQCIGQITESTRWINF